MKKNRDPIHNLNIEVDRFLVDNEDRIRLVGRAPDFPFATHFDLRATGVWTSVMDGAGYKVVQGAPLRLVFPASYPSEPPAVFVPNAYHPNVSGELGWYMCWMAVGEWRPRISVSEIISGVMEILGGGSFSPVTADPFPNDERCVSATREFMRLKQEGLLPFQGSVS